MGGVGSEAGQALEFPWVHGEFGIWVVTAATFSSGLRRDASVGNLEPLVWRLYFKVRELDAVAQVKETLTGH